MTKESIITVFEKELSCHNVYTEKGGTCPDDVDCSECECFVSDGTLHKAIKAAVDILKEVSDMEMVKGTSAENGQTVWIPLNRVASIRYPVDNGHTLIVWTDADGTIAYEAFKECPRDLEFGEIGPKVK